MADAREAASGTVPPEAFVRDAACIDIETAPCPIAAGLVDRSGAAAKNRRPIHRLSAATILSFKESGDDARIGDLELRSWRVPDGHEAEVIRAVEDALPNPSGNSVLITFNGRGHDMPVLRHRAMSHWNFEVPRIAGWNQAGPDAHVDLMRWLSNEDESPWPSLAAACAALSIPVKCVPHGQRVGTGGTLLANQCDAVSTFLLYLHRSSLIAGTPARLAQGWSALADHLDSNGEVPSHLAPYARHAFVKLARRIMKREAGRERRAA